MDSHVGLYADELFDTTMNLSIQDDSLFIRQAEPNQIVVPSLAYPADETDVQVFGSTEEYIASLERQVGSLQNELTQVRAKGKLISQELDLFRQRRVVFWSDRFRNTFDAWNLMNQGFQQLKDDCALFGGSIKGYRLQPSLSLLRVPFLTYRVRLTRPRLRAITVAPIVDVPLTSGEICVRIFSSPENYLCTSAAPVSAIRDDAPIRLEFPTIESSDQHELIFRVFVQGVDAPVRIFEMRRYALGGFGRLSTIPFAGYVFD
jgi:hypothetical protein